MELLLGIVLFNTIMSTLVAVVLLARAQLVSSEAIAITICQHPERSFTATAGSKLLNLLASQGIFVSSACGGGGVLVASVV